MPPIPQFTPAQTAAPQASDSKIEEAVAEAKASMQAQIKDLQTKYQEQRQKWERTLADLRSRNDELNRQNQSLEEELSALKERQRNLIREFSSRSGSQPGAPSPPSIEAALPQAPEGQYRSDERQTARAEAPEISIEVPAQPQAGLAGGQHEATFEIPMAKEEEPSAGEADDLLAELDALEKEMKNLGGEGQG